MLRKRQLAVSIGFQKTEEGGITSDSQKYSNTKVLGVSLLTCAPRSGTTSHHDMF